MARTKTNPAKVAPVKDSPPKMWLECPAEKVFLEGLAFGKTKLKVIGYKTVKIASVDIETSIRCNPRISGMIQKERAEQYAGMMTLGRKFSAVVLMECEKPNTYQTLGGLTRIEACNLNGRAEVYALVIANFNEKLREAVRAGLNSLNGLPEDVACMTEQAARYVADGFMDVQTASACFGIARRTLSQHMEVFRFCEKREAQGIDLSKAKRGTIRKVMSAPTEGYKIELA